MLPAVSELLEKSLKENLYGKIIQQLNKDFLLANVSYHFSEEINPSELKKTLVEILHEMVINNYDDYLNLIYRIDISEKDLAKIKGQSLKLIVDEITYLILKREYQKVWFRNTI
ncbi:MAG: hypothetical protein R3342_08030 [Lutibacter sp.]|uniref:hypothetical protein n=1 Tax=Lutibacter sp. TaxID=1925666 RepID=UPI00299E0E25|nr:hypothetical protein [Lutibacter sp.]MDX1829478.1 hypothetical protein [Lutibacter sp.]